MKTKSGLISLNNCSRVMSVTERSRNQRWYPDFGSVSRKTQCALWVNLDELRAALTSGLLTALNITAAVELHTELKLSKLREGDESDTH